MMPYEGEFRQSGRTAQKIPNILKDVVVKEGKNRGSPLCNDVRR